MTFEEMNTGELIDSQKFQEEISKSNILGGAFDSPEMLKIQEELSKEHQKSIDRSVGWYYNLSEEDKYKAVEALCHIICKAEREGTSHRGLQHTLGLYPQAFWIDDLMTVHNALWSYYHDEKQKQELKDDLDALEKFTET
jgi:hypothetical protein